MTRRRSKRSVSNRSVETRLDALESEQDARTPPEEFGHELSPEDRKWLEDLGRPESEARKELKRFAESDGEGREERGTTLGAAWRDAVRDGEAVEATDGDPGPEP